MIDIIELLKKPEFYLKLIELGLCIVSTLFITSFKEPSYVASNHSTEMSIHLAVPNSIVTISVLLILLVLELEYQITEICLLIAAAVLNLVLGVILIADISNDSPAKQVFLAIFMVSCGVVMVLDIIREFKNVL